MNRLRNQPGPGSGSAGSCRDAVMASAPGRWERAHLTCNHSALESLASACASFWRAWSCRHFGRRFGFHYGVQKAFDVFQIMGAMGGADELRWTTGRRQTDAHQPSIVIRERSLLYSWFVLR